MGIKPSPDNHLLSRASYYLGLIYLKKEEFPAAKEYLEKSLEFDPEAHDAKSALNKLKRRDMRENTDSDPSGFYTF
jgi:uncharacterized protein HemY